MNHNVHKSILEPGNILLIIGKYNLEDLRTFASRRQRILGNEDAGAHRNVRKTFQDTNAKFVGK